MVIGRREKLNSHPPGEMFVLSEVDNTHAAFTKFVDDSIVGNRLTDHFLWNPSSARKEET
jgi:hypothetical protein